MRKAPLLIIPVLVVIVIGAVFAVYESRRTPEWRVELNRYTAVQDATEARTTTVLAATKARQPWNLTRDARTVVYGDSAHYITDAGYGGQSAGSGTIPLPYPPEEVWCALLKQERTSTGTSEVRVAYDVVLVALHQDLYNADWVVHAGIGDPSGQRAAELLPLVGCAVPSKDSTP
jgi:hypothetical protein